MGKRLDIEYCRSCEDIYATYANVWLCFNVVSGESSHVSQRTFNCPRCGCLIERYSGFIEALEKRDSSEFIDSALAEIGDLSRDALSLLRSLLTKFSVPSFASYITRLPGDAFDELYKKRYVDLTDSDTLSFAVLNAHKLSLMDNVELLEKMAHQREFILHPEYLKLDRKHSERRKARTEALVNDFTDVEKDKLVTSFEGRCALTGKDVPLHFDHVIPLAVGHGGTTLSNMLPIWQRINSSKGTKNIFEWYEEAGDRFEVLPELFEKAIEYLADLNDMSVQEYRDYVYDCHANPNDILTEVI